MEFVSFHSHNTYSYADALGHPMVHARRVAELGMTALGTSNHGNTNDHAAHEKACIEHNIKPIFGCEVYFAPVDENRKSKRKTHLTIFAMNEQGYRNLNLIITQSYKDFFQWPTVSWESLVKHNEGLLVFSGCADSLISCKMLGGKFLGEQRTDISDFAFESARRTIQRFYSVFGDRYALEVQRFPHFGRTCTLNPAYEKLSSDTGIPLVATADVHYPFAEQNKLQAMLHAARWKMANEFENETAWELKAKLTYPLSDEEIHADLVATGISVLGATSAISNSKTLAERCTVELPKARPLKFPVPKGQGNSAVYFRQQIIRGLRQRTTQRPDIDDRIDEYKKRINYEHKIIADKSFQDYFLMAADLVQRAKARSTDVGPARGSAAASLISYCLGITEIDPLHPLFRRMNFERFIDPYRSDWPDIDLDFDDEKRKETEKDAKAIYGADHVANVANHTGYHGRNTLKDVARAYGLPAETFKAIASRTATRVETDDRRFDSIADVLEGYAAHPEISRLIETFPTQLAMAVALESGDGYGNEREMGVHACGYIISSDPITNVCPIYTRESGSGREKTNVSVIPYEKRDAEYLNMLKVDFLGSSTMGVIGLIRGWSDYSLEDMYLMIYRDYEKQMMSEGLKEFLPEKDKSPMTKVFKRFQADDVVGIMQFEGGTTRQVCRQVQPDDFDTLAACTALSRPGPYYGGQFKEYVAVRNGEKDWARIHPTGFDRHVDWTYGQIVYQEQIMWILRDLAGFDNKEVLRVRKIIGKKLGEFQFEQILQKFVDGCRQTCNVDEDTARRVFAGIRTSAAYAFNTAHAYSYGLIAYWQQKFKMEFPTAFFAATLAKNGEEKKRIPRRTAVLQDCVAHGVGVDGWNIDECDVSWKPRSGVKPSVMPGFLQMPKVGEATAEDIVKWRNELPFADYDNLTWEGLGRPNDKGGCAGIGVGTAERLAAFAARPDPLGINRTRDQLTSYRQQLKAGVFVDTVLPGHLDGYVRSSFIPGPITGIAFVGLVGSIKYRDEIESIRSRTGLAIDVIRAQMDDPERTKKATIFAYDEDGEVSLRVSRWQYPKLRDRLEAIKEDHHVIVVIGDTFEAQGNSIQVKNLWVLDPD